MIDEIRQEIEYYDIWYNRN